MTAQHLLLNPICSGIPHFHATYEFVDDVWTMSENHKPCRTSHSTVNYVFTYPFEYLVQYHQLVMDEMEKRSYQVNPNWRQPGYRGQRTPATEFDSNKAAQSNPIYAEHHRGYLQECLENLRNKGVQITSGG